MSPVDRQGELFAGYLIEIALGRGGMSEVYRAKNPRLGNLVAIKMLAPELTEDALFRERFIRESQIAASLDHPNVIPIHDAGEENGVPYIAMRYVDGPDLAQLIQRDLLPIEHTVSIVAQVASALDAAHERGLIHRDVKPANVLIDRYVGLDSVPHIYLSDFGIAKHTMSQSGLTSTGQFVGTIDYVAPEQIEGKQVDRRTDVYSLGCVLYECLTGVKPFQRDSNVAVMYAHLLEPPPRPSELRQETPAELDEVVAKAMAKSRDERYATCGELAAAARAPFARARADAPEPTVAAPVVLPTVVAPVVDPIVAAPPLEPTVAAPRSSPPWPLPRSSPPWPLRRSSRPPRSPSHFRRRAPVVSRAGFGQDRPARSCGGVCRGRLSSARSSLALGGVGFAAVAEPDGLDGADRRHRVEP